MKCLQTAENQLTNLEEWKNRFWIWFC